jgi:hypothetical protein
VVRVEPLRTLCAGGHAMAGINIMVDQAYKDIEAMIESLENSVEE